MPKIIFSIPFTGKTPYGNGFSGQDWYDYRANIFKDYTLKSLMNQTDKDFIIWAHFRPEEEANPTTKIIENALEESGLDYILTFNGPIIMEDRATWHNVDLIERAEKSLKKLEPIEDEWVVEISLDSDDMVFNRLVEIIKTKEMRTRGAFFMKRGFMYDSENKRMASWNNPFSMSVYAITYPTNIFLDAKKHFIYQRGFNSHEQIPKLFNAEQLPDGMYCVLTHGKNISTVWEHEYREQEFYYEDEVNNILKDFK